jgi:glycolate oxidase
VVPRSALPAFLSEAQAAAARTESGVVGCGHAGDGNVHLAVFQKDPDKRARLLHEIFAAGMELGGAISGEHGIGRAKKDHFLRLEDPVKIELMSRVKRAFDPAGILNPGVLFGRED